MKKRKKDILFSNITIALLFLSVIGLVSLQSLSPDYSRSMKNFQDSGMIPAKDSHIKESIIPKVPVATMDSRVYICSCKMSEDYWAINEGFEDDPEWRVVPEGTEGAVFVENSGYVIADGIKYASGDNVEYSPSGNSVPMLGSAFGLSFVPIHCTADQSDFQDNCWTLDFNLNGIVEENAFTCEPLGFYMDWFVDPDNACESAGGAPCEWTPNCPENTYDCDDPDFNGDDPSCVGHYKYWNYYSNAV